MIFSHNLRKAITISVVIHATNAGCPFAKKNLRPQMQSIYTSTHTELRSLQSLQSGRTGDGGVPAAGYSAVKQDIIEILTISQDFFPADFADTVGANYGPLMIRLAWHCSGSYRATDGRGGCDGGRIRHDPELSWPDNANLDKALKLLEPIKEKYGSDLSWGDLVILAGNAAIESMGGPVLGFCGGRIDDIDGSNSLILGPSPEQEELTPCVNDGDQGACTGNLGPTTVGLIYVNPAGHLDNPDPSGLIIDDIRSSFGKMGMNDTETLALAGGGHAFGKCHGACESPPCGEGDMAGKGPNTFTSGFEGAWTTVPTSWTNQYFTNLFEFDWKLITGPGGNPQWAPVSKSGSNDVPDIMMLTSDIALTKDPEFTKISQAFADDISTLDEHFQHAWYKLTTGDMGPVTRCLGDDVPPAQAFQVPLPTSPSSDDSDYIKIRKAIQDIIDDDKEKRGCFINLASKCGNTYRETDYQGGCNGAFIRYDEDSKIQMELKLLDPVVKDFPNASFADILVLAGQVALEDAGSEPLAFCPGRNDATDKHGRDHLNPIIYDSRIEPTVRVKDAMTVKGLTAHQGVALAATPMGTDDLDNQHFIDLMKASDAGEQGTIKDDDWALVQDEELKAIVKLYAESKAAFLTEFTRGWTYLMTADRFNGPRNNVCSGVSAPTLGTNAASLKSHDDGPNGVSIALISVGSILAVIGVGALVMSSKKAAAVK